MTRSAPHLDSTQSIYEVARFVGIPGEAITRFVGALKAAGFLIVPATPVGWRREWDGDVSDLGMWVHADSREELDEHGPWQALYSEEGPDA